MIVFFKGGIYFDQLKNLITRNNLSKNERNSKKSPEFIKYFVPFLTVLKELSSSQIPRGSKGCENVQITGQSDPRTISTLFYKMGFTKKPEQAPS